MKTFNTRALLHILTVTILPLGILLFGGCASTKQIMVRAWSADDYQRTLLNDNTPKRETYVFHKGIFEPGSFPDKSLLSESDFLKVAEQLKTALEAQNYYNATQGEKVDLVISVHWGQTLIQEETVYIEMMDDEGNIEEFEYEQITGESLKKNALMLGTADKIFTQRRGYERDEMIAQASDERYYFVLIAYDYNEVMQKRKKILWVTQFSVDTTGTNYLDALPAMTRIASQYFGKNLKDLEFNRANLGNATVEFGEIEVVGAED